MAQQVAEIRKQYPQHPQAIFLDAVAHRFLGDSAYAVKHLSKLSKRLPDAAAIHLELGIAFRAEGRTNDAVRALRKAVAIQPLQSRGWQLLGEMLADRGETVASDQAFRQQMAVAATHPGLVKAVELVADGKLGMAEGICREYLYRHPTDVNAIRLLADIGLQLDIFADAEKLLRRALELAPDYHLARNNFANALSKGGKFNESMVQLSHLEAVDPQNLAHPVLAASVLVNVGDYQGAITRYERVLKQVPRHSRLQMSLGHALKTVGRREESVSAYRRAIEIEPALGEAYWSLANLKTFKFAAREIQTMRRLLSGYDIDVRDEYHLCFSLGKALEDVHLYDESFAYYERGNRLKMRESGYRSQDNSAQMNAIMQSCTRERFALRKDFGHIAPDPIFILGLPRSGSTLLEQILASHSQVDGTMELPNILQFVRRLAAKKNKNEVSRYPTALWDLTSQDCEALGQEYLEATAVQRQGAPFFIDKMPNNFPHIGLIHLILPNAKIIDTRREAMASCFSGFKQLFAAGQEFTYGLDEVGRYYADYVRMMQHWDAVLPGKVLRMQYEEVVDDVEAQVRRMLAYCGLPFEDNCLAFYRNDRAVRTASSEQVRQPIYRDSMDQWRHFERHLEPLRQGLKYNAD
ncbi:MAG: tetratricopeptide repeat protein [Gammaproteobacteria bacterium]|nr:tetratricopeptide repeat protein [Gammaproteobacteria bacterium]